MKNLFVLFLISISFQIFCQEKKEIIAKTDVNAATIFINGAQVTRNKTIDIPSGNSVIKFVNLSPYIDTKSVQVKAIGELTVLSVNHQFNFIDTLSRTKELEEMNSKLLVIDDKLKVENTNLIVINEQLEFYKDNRVIGGRNQETSLTNLKETSNYYGDRISSLRMKEIDVNKTIANYNKEKAAINNQIKQLGSNKIYPSGEVVVSVEAKAQTKCEFELTYFVNNAGWIPSYDIRAKSIDEPIELVYKANIHQNTKEEWKNIKLTLSSSDPNLGSLEPQLQTYLLSYNSLPPKYTNLNNQVSGRIYDSKTNQPMIGATIQIRGTTIGTVADVNGNYSLAIPNTASELQVSYIGYAQKILPINAPIINVGLDEEITGLQEVVVVGYGAKKKSGILSSIRGKSSVENYKDDLSGSISSFSIPVTQVENQTSFEFEIKTPYTINSDNKNITVDIDHYSLNADYEYHCVPKVDKDAFLVANITDWEKYNLLEGEANIFFENTFVGKSILDVRYISDTLSISLGRDKNVIVKRDKIKDFTTRQFLGNKKEETRDWKISIRNNKKQAINMILFDQIPVSTLEEIEVSVDNISGASLNKDKGEIKWKFNLEQSGHKEFELKYKVKYPKGRTLIVE
jgi:Domain of unknown function (DUF4139)/N-terminal domain of unknown function (DUF4140)